LVGCDTFVELKLLNQKAGIVISQRKYSLDILEETGMLEVDCKHVDTHGISHHEYKYKP